MAQDIRKMLRENEAETSKLPKGHQSRFEARLESNFPKKNQGKNKNRNYLILKIAAALVIVFGISFFFLDPTSNFNGPEVTNTPEQEDPQNSEIIPVSKTYQLSDVSPEFKKIENYYLANLNIELAKLEMNDGNKTLIDSFMKQLAGLDEEYKKLNLEISETGLNESSIEALISNLQLRLELLYKLKNKINNINQSKNSNHENYNA